MISWECKVNDKVNVKIKIKDEIEIKVKNEKFIKYYFIERSELKKKSAAKGRAPMQTLFPYSFLHDDELKTNKKPRELFY
jgi:hypothetical protein